MDSGKLLVWRVKPNDHVKRGDIMAEIETDKSAIEIETFEDGIVDQLLVEPGATVPVGTVLATIRPESAPPD